MTTQTTRKLRHLINKHLKTLHEHSLDLKKSLYEIYNVDPNNYLFSLETGDNNITLKSDALKLFPQYEERIVIDGDYPYFKGEFYVKDNDTRIFLASFFIDIFGRLTVNKITESWLDTTSVEAFNEILDAIFDGAINNKLITP